MRLKVLGAYGASDAEHNLTGYLIDDWFGVDAGTLTSKLSFARQTMNWEADPEPPPRGLPALELSWKLPSPEIPHRLGWLNYWSAASARAIGFPDADRDADLLTRARRTEMGGWVVRLTDEPLNLDIPAHLDALLRAYERFPAIGGRSVR